MKNKNEIFETYQMIDAVFLNVHELPSTIKLK